MDDRLAEVLSALASPNRLALLRQLRQPRCVTEIRLPPEEGEERPIARQAVRVHLRKLMDAGVVAPVERGPGASVAYLVNHQRIFAITEEVRALAALRPDEGAVDQPTLDDVRQGRREDVFPRFLLVRGLHEGRTFPVRAPAEGSAWLVGRKPSASICIDYDPYVSLENTRVTWSGGRYAVESLPSSRNGTTLNFRPVAGGRPEPIHHGDLLGVGRTLLLFQTHTGAGP